MSQQSQSTWRWTAMLHTGFSFISLQCIWEKKQLLPALTVEPQIQIHLDKKRKLSIEPSLTNIYWLYTTKGLQNVTEPKTVNIGCDGICKAKHKLVKLPLTWRLNQIKVNFLFSFKNPVQWSQLWLLSGQIYFLHNNNNNKKEIVLAQFTKHCSYTESLRVMPTNVNMDKSGLSGVQEGLWLSSSVLGKSIAFWGRPIAMESNISC